MDLSERKEFSEECIERFKGEEHHEKPQLRSLLRSRDIRALSIKILEGLGEKDPDLVLKVRKYRCQNRDVAIYVSLSAWGVSEQGDWEGFWLGCGIRLFQGSSNGGRNT